MFGGTIVQADFMQLSPHSRKYFKNEKCSSEKRLFIRPLRLFFQCDHLKLIFHKGLKEPPNTLLNYISTPRFLRKLLECSLKFPSAYFNSTMHEEQAFCYNPFYKVINTSL